MMSKQARAILREMFDVFKDSYLLANKSASKGDVERAFLKLFAVNFTHRHYMQFCEKIEKLR